MNKADLLFLLDYTLWANRKLLAAATRLSPELFTAPHRTTYGSLRGILAHMLKSFRVWRIRCQDERMPVVLPAPEDFPDLATFTACFEEEQAAVRAYIAALSEEDLQRGVHYTANTGATYTNTLWMIFAHVINHATQHRSEAAELLTEYGCSPGDLDLIVYLREK